MTDCRFSRLLAKLEIPLLLAVPAVMAAPLLAGVEQAALAMLIVVALVLALFFAGYEASSGLAPDYAHAGAGGTGGGGGAFCLGPFPTLNRRAPSPLSRGRRLVAAMVLWSVRWRR